MLRLDNIGRLKDTGKVPRTALTTNLLPVIFLSTSTSNETPTPVIVSLSKLLIGSSHK